MTTMSASPSPPAVHSIEAIKRAITGYAALGGVTSFDDFNILAFYDQAKAEWLVEPERQPVTLLSKGQLDLIEELAACVHHAGVVGDFIEAGVWRGGAIILMRTLLDALGIRDRQVIAADSFAGIPLSTRFRHDPVDLWADRWAASLDEVKTNIARFGLLDARIEFVEGNFADCLPALAGRRLALIRLDADSHDSTTDALTYLYPLLQPGGVIIIDDWHLIGCRLAVDAYRAAHGITDEVVTKAGNGYWFKS
jgi:O-methyltransferase